MYTLSFILIVEMRWDGGCECSINTVNDQNKQLDQTLALQYHIAEVPKLVGQIPPTQ